MTALKILLLLVVSIKHSRWCLNWNSGSTGQTLPPSSLLRCILPICITLEAIRVSMHFSTAFVTIIAHVRGKLRSIVHIDTGGRCRL